MKVLETICFAAAAVMAVTTLTASSASATTIEEGKVTTNASVTLTVSLEAGGTVILSRTDGTLADTCAEAHTKGATSSPFTGTKVTGSWSSLTYAKCTGAVTGDSLGQFYIEHVAGTTDADVYLENTELTFATSLGVTVNCKTGAGTKVGRINGVSSGNAKFTLNAVLNCGFLLPSATWKGSLIVTSPFGFGVSP